MTDVPNADLLLDTARAAAGVGMRGAGSATRQLVYRRGAHQLDVSAPAPHGKGGLRFVWGQLLTNGGAACVGARVSWLAAGGDVLASADTDEFGEFRLASSAPDDSALLVGAPDAAFLCQLPAGAASR